MHVSQKNFSFISCALAFMHYSHMPVAFPQGVKARTCFSSRNFPERSSARKAVLSACCAVISRKHVFNPITSLPAMWSFICGH